MPGASGLRGLIHDTFVGRVAPAPAEGGRYTRFTRQRGLRGSSHIPRQPSYLLTVRAGAGFFVDGKVWWGFKLVLRLGL